MCDYISLHGIKNPILLLKLFQQTQIFLITEEAVYILVLEL